MTMCLSTRTLLLPACCLGLLLCAVPARCVDTDFQHFRDSMLETTKISLAIEKKYRDCLAEAADRDDYFFCRDMRDQALHLDTGARVGQQLNPDASFVWDNATSDLYLQVSERAIRGKEDTLFCLEHADSMATYEQCLVRRKKASRPSTP
jgi:hypothetical protein